MKQSHPWCRPLFSLQICFVAGDGVQAEDVNKSRVDDFISLLTCTQPLLDLWHREKRCCTSGINLIKEKAMRQVNEELRPNKRGEQDKKVTHRECVERLFGSIGEQLVADLCKRTKAVKMARGYRIPVCYKTTEEVVIREEEEIRQDGTVRKSNRKIDAVIFVEPGDMALCQDWDFTIGVEVKSSVRDLIRDVKIPHYLGWTDLFFLAVPDNLIGEAKRKVADIDAIGVFALDSGRIVKRPNAQNVPASQRLELMKEAFFKHNMKSNKIWL